MAKRKSKDLELRIYEILGVRIFNKMVFMLEKFIHRKDGLKNINYHPKDITVDSFKDFIKFLYYNGYIHVKNSLVLTLVIVVVAVCFPSVSLFILIPELIRNLYCVMLQRYNYKQMKNSIKKHEDRLEKRYEEKLDDFVHTEEYTRAKELLTTEQMEQIEHIRKFLLGQEDLIIDESYREVLQIILDYLNTQKTEINTPKLMEETLNDELVLKRKRSDYNGR